MATIDELINQINILVATMNRGGANPNGAGGGRADFNFDTLQTSGEKLADKLIEYGLRTDQGAKLFGVGLSTFNTKFNDGAHFFNKTIKESGAAFTADLLSGSKTVQEVTAEFEKTRQAIVGNLDITDQQKELYIQQVKAMEDWVQKDAVVQFNQKKYSELTGKVTKTFEVLDSTVGKMIKTYQGSSDGFNTAANLAKDGISMAGGAAQKAGGFISNAGAALGMIPGPAKLVGIGLQVVGGVLGLVGSAAREVAEKAMPIMQNQMNAMSKAYSDVTSTGALFGNGMTEMIKTSADAGISMGTFSSIIKNNAGDLARSGLGIAEGAKQVAGVGKIMRESGTQEQLLKFGVSLEEQGGLVAQTVAKMRAGGGGAVDQSKVAEYTAKYAKDLKTLGDLTGEDVKSKEKQAQEAANNLAFQQELASMAPEQRAKIQDAMKNMTALEQKAFMERMINNGELMSEDTNMMASQSKAFADKTSQMFKDAQSGVLDLGRQTELNTQYGEAMKQDMLAMKDVAKAAFAGVESVGALAKNAMEQLTQSLTQTPEALAKAQEARAKLEKSVAEGGDPVTAKFAQITLEGEKLRSKLDELVGTGKAMDLYLAAVKQASELMLGTVGKFTGGDKFVEKQRDEVNTKDNMNWEKMGLGENIESGFARSIEIATKGVGSVLSAIGIDAVKNLAYDMQKERVEAEDKYMQERGAGADKEIIPPSINNLLQAIGLPRFADGGFASGPDSGFPVMLHGAEAVLPLDNNESMAKIKDALFGGSSNSVINPESEEAMMATQSAAFADKTSRMFNDAMQQITASTSSTDASTALQEKMTQVMERGFADMVKVMSDIAYHTENTSVRVA
jgi:hypothetical protein